VVFALCERTNRQTDRHTGTLITILHTPTRGGVLINVFSGALHGRYEDNEDGKDDIKAMLNVLLRKLNGAENAGVQPPRAYINVTEVEQHDRSRPTNMHNIVSHVHLFLV